MNDTEAPVKKIVLGVLAHVDAGKTTLCEALLFHAGVIRRQGRVDHGDTALDCHPLEKDRGITIFAGEASFQWGDTAFTLLDTPGHVDFSAETERTLQVLDYAILVISATDGIQAHTRTVWRLLALYGIPVFIFVTKCDRLQTQRRTLLEALEKEFGSVADFTQNENGFADAEAIAACDEALLEEYLADGTMQRATLCRAVKSRRLFPCFFGSGLKNEGVEAFASALACYTESRTFPEAFGARVFKISHDKTDRLTKLRVTGGVLRVKDVIACNGQSEKVNQIRLYAGNKYVCVNEVPAGTVCTVTGLTQTEAGRGLGNEEGTVTGTLEPVMRYRIVLPADEDPKTVFPKLKSLEEEDPQLHISYSERLGEFHCTLMGQVQAEIFKSMVEERFGLSVGIAEGRVIYKETVTNTVEGVGHYEPLRHYAEVHLLIEPGERNSGVVLANRCSENELDRSWQRLILTHLAEKTHVGVLTGSPLTDVKITLVDGRAHIKHTEGGDFRQATYRAVRQGLMQAQSLLLEPFYAFRLEVPAASVGRAITDVRQMGGRFEQPLLDGEVALLTGTAPVTAMGDYMQQVTAYTGGCGHLALELSGYEPCHDAQRVIEAMAYQPGHDLDNPVDSVFCAHGAGFAVKWDEVSRYMHLNSYFSKKKPTLSAYRHISIDEKELQAILLKEFGPVQTKLYRPTVHASRQETAVQACEAVTRCLIVDGYNIIFGWNDLKALAEEDLDDARHRLIRLLSNYARFTGQRVIVVFDGYKVPGNTGEKDNIDGLEVVFTRENETGDNYIERLIEKIGKNEQVRVVTSDGMIRLSAVRTGVAGMSAADFEAEVQKADREIAELIEKNNAK